MDENTKGKRNDKINLYYTSLAIIVIGIILTVSTIGLAHFYKSDFGDDSSDERIEKISLYRLLQNAGIFFCLLGIGLIGFNLYTLEKRPDIELFIFFSSVLIIVGSCIWMAGVYIAYEAHFSSYWDAEGEYLRISGLLITAIGFGLILIGYFRNKAKDLE